MANTSQAPDLVDLHCEMHNIAKQIRVMNENNACLIQHLTKNNPPPPATPVPKVERSLYSNDRAMLSLRVTRVLTEHEIGDVNHPVHALGERKKSKLDVAPRILRRSNVQDFLYYTKKGSARSWFRKLSPRTIDSFGDLSRLFVANFMSYRVRQKKASHLFTIYQKETESLKEYVKRFNQAVLEVEDPSDKLVKAKQKRRGRDDHKRKELDTRRSDYREEVKNKRSDRDSREEVKNKRSDWDSRRTNDKRPCIPPRCPELDFIVIDCPSPYNAILGRPNLGGTKAITSTYHLKMKFPTSTGISKVMPFSLKNAGATYLRLVNKMFKKLIGKTLEVYIDDMLIKSIEVADHISHLEEAFSILRKNQMMLNPSKCIFCVSSGKFLRFLVIERGIEANPDQIQALPAMSSPRNIHEEYLSSPPLVTVPTTGEELIVYLFVTWPTAIKPKENPPEVETPEGQDPEENLTRWKLFVDGSSNDHGCEVGLVLQTPPGEQMESRILDAFSDSQLVVNQIQRDYLTKDTQMVAYLGEVKAMSGKIKDFKISQIPREKNKKADALANLASAFDFISDKNVPLEFLPNPSIEVTKSICQTKASPTWMDNIIAYLQNGTLPQDKLQARRIQYRSAKFCILHGVLYKIRCRHLDSRYEDKIVLETIFEKTSSPQGSFSSTSPIIANCSPYGIFLLSLQYLRNFLPYLAVRGSRQGYPSLVGFLHRRDFERPHPGR
ncbi:hypothetical protein Acr_00g0034770 [Actinidia rufa]|uniref:Reverse transcriptase domain-containing protein n=1 Tax=Actinidia rufa TaxID=165716 RepID=A0A7J0DGH7_9ERIC|nr:hypothetical protein Acr_00g0034770 [Actinidia rufa]